MTKFSVVTSMDQKYYDRVGHKMIESFIEQWDESITLTIFTEDHNFSYKHPRVETVSLHSDADYVAFHARHKDRVENPEELNLGAKRFSHKVFAVLNGSKKVKTQYMIWLDADTFTFDKIDESWLDSLVSPTSQLTYLGRKGNYSECGFVIYNLAHTCTNDFMLRWRQYYKDDSLFRLAQWHDCWAFDILRDRYQRIGVDNVNLSPNGKGYEHVFVNSILGEKMDRMKGARKDRGKSDSQDLRQARKEDYWNAY